MFINRIFTVLFWSLFIFPLVVVALQISITEGFPVDFMEISQSLAFSLSQAFLSAVLSVLLGAISALGLLRYRSKKYFSVLESLLWVPNLFPALLVIVSLINVFNWVGDFPYGLMGVVIAHSCINIGLATITFISIFQFRLSVQAEVALVEGATQFQFFKSFLLPTIIKDGAFVFLFVFVICLSSFSIPLILGGVHSTSLEVLIYEKIKLQGQWSVAALISLLQVGLILGLYSFIRKFSFYRTQLRFSQSQLLQLKGAELIPFTLTAFLFLGLGLPAFEGFKNLFSVIDKSLLIQHILTTLSVSLLCGAITIFIAFIYLLSGHRSTSKNLLVAFGVPSSACLSFGFYSLGFHHPFSQRVLLSFVLALVFFIPCYRLFLHQRLGDLEEQIDSARILGSSVWQRVTQIVWPQVSDSVFYMGALAAIWACGDFAISSIILDKEDTLALYIKSLMSLYRFDVATALSLFLVVMGILIFLLFKSFRKIVYRT